MLNYIGHLTGLERGIDRHDTDAELVQCLEVQEKFGAVVKYYCDPVALPITRIAVMPGKLHDTFKGLAITILHQHTPIGGSGLWGYMDE